MKIGDRLFLLDALVVILISAAITVACDRLLFMTIFVPAIIGLRIVFWHRLTNKGLGIELLFLLGCTLLGGFNDFNTVVRHGVYDYSVPYFSDLTTIPFWMLIYWGMILRFVVSLCRWQRLKSPDAPRDTVRFGIWSVQSGLLKVMLQLAIVFVTRQFIYQYFEHPILSWVPFLAGLVLYVTLFGLTRLELKLVLLFGTVGPLVEVLYIAAGLHRYHLGWLAGVPLWIALWWMLAMLIWRDLSFRVQNAILTKRSLALDPASRPM